MFEEAGCGAGVAFDEFLLGGFGGGGELSEHDGVFEVGRFEADHVGAGDFVAVAVDVDLADARAVGLWVDHFGEGDREEVAALDGDLMPPVRSRDSSRRRVTAPLPRSRQ